MRVPLFIFALTALTACGADGPPEAPASMDAAASGVTFSGCAKIGVALGPVTKDDPADC